MYVCMCDRRWFITVKKRTTTGVQQRQEQREKKDNKQNWQYQTYKKICPPAQRFRDLERDREKKRRKKKRDRDKERKKSCCFAWGSKGEKAGTCYCCRRCGKADLLYSKVYRD